jgi:hypothetical protein
MEVSETESGGRRDGRRLVHVSWNKENLQETKGLGLMAAPVGANDRH